MKRTASHVRRRSWAVWLVGPVLALLIPVACGDSSSDGSAGEGELTVRFLHRSDSSDLQFDQVLFENAAGNEYSVTTFEYLVTNIRLISESGDVVELADAVLGNAATRGGNSHVFDGIPADRYVEIEFRWGVDPAVNETDYLPAAFDNMLWPETLGGGYHNMMFEGDWTVVTEGDSSFSLHSGYLRDCRDTMLSFEDCMVGDRLEFQGSFVVSLDDFEIELGEVDAVIDIAIDVANWMNDPSVDFIQDWTDQTICPDQPAESCTFADWPRLNPETQQLLYDNRENVFSIATIVTTP